MYQFIVFIVSILQSFLHTTWHQVRTVLYFVYRHGPAFLGFWHGIDDQSVCTHLVRNLDASHWRRQPELCHALIERHFHSYLIGFACMILLILSLSLFYCILLRICCIHPVLSIFHRSPSRRRSHHHRSKWWWCCQRRYHTKRDD